MQLCYNLRRSGCLGERKYGIIYVGLDAWEREYVIIYVGLDTGSENVV